MLRTTNKNIDIAMTINVPWGSTKTKMVEIINNIEISEIRVKMHLTVPGICITSAKTLLLKNPVLLFK